MKKLNITLLFLYFLGTSLAFAQPKLEIVGGDTVNWGKKRLDESPLTHKLKLINTGNKDLIFTSINPSCGCTTAPIDKTELKPGDSAFIDITFNLPNFAGRAQKGIQINNNDPKAKHKIVYLVADIVFPLKFFPGQSFTFPGLLLGDSMTARVVMTNTTDEDIVIKQVKLSGADLETNLKDETVVKAKDALSIDVVAKPRQIGTQAGELTFKTTHPDVVRVKIPIILNVLGEIPPEEQIIKY